MDPIQHDKFRPPGTPLQNASPNCGCLVAVGIAIFLVLAVPFVGAMLMVILTVPALQERGGAPRLEATFEDNPDEYQPRNNMSDIRPHYQQRTIEVSPAELKNLQTRLSEILENIDEADSRQLRQQIDYQRLLQQVHSSPLSKGQPTALTVPFLLKTENHPPSESKISIAAVKKIPGRDNELIIYAYVEHPNTLMEERCYWMIRDPTNDDPNWRLFDWMLVGAGISNTDCLAIFNYRVTDGQITVYEQFENRLAEVRKATDANDLHSIEYLLASAARLEQSPWIYDYTRMLLMRAAYYAGKYEYVFRFAEEIRQPDQIPAYYFLQSLAYNSLLQSEEAIASARKYIELVGPSPTMLETEHESLWRLNRYSEALVAREREANCIPDLLEYQTYLVEVTPWSRLDLVTHSLERFLNFHPDRLDVAYLQFADALNYDSRRPGLELLLSHGGDRLSDLTRLQIEADLAFERGEIDSGLQKLKSALELPGIELDRNETLHERILEIAGRQFDFDQAYELATDKYLMLRLIGDGYTQYSEWITGSRLASIAEKHLQEFPDDLWGQYFQAIATGDQFLMPAAIDQLQALLAKPDLEMAEHDLKTRVRRSLSFYCFALGRLEEALANSDDPNQSMLDFGRVAVAKQDRETLQRLVETGEELDDTWSATAWCRAHLMLLSNQADRAIELLTEAAKNPSESESVDFRQELIDAVLAGPDRDFAKLPELDTEQYLELCNDLKWQEDFETLSWLLTHASPELQRDTRHKYYRIIALDGLKKNDEVSREIGNERWYAFKNPLTDEQNSDIKYIHFFNLLQREKWEKAKFICTIGTRDLSLEELYQPEGLSISDLAPLVSYFDVESGRVPISRWLIGFLSDGDQTPEIQYSSDVRGQFEFAMESLHNIGASPHQFERARARLPRWTSFSFSGEKVFLLLDKPLESSTANDWLDKFAEDLDLSTQNELTPLKAQADLRGVRTQLDGHPAILFAGNRPLTNRYFYSVQEDIRLMQAHQSFVAIEVLPKDGKNVNPVESDWFRQWLASKLQSNASIQAVFFERQQTLLAASKALAWMQAFNQDEQPDTLPATATAELYPIQWKQDSQIAMRQDQLRTAMDSFDLDSSRTLHIQTKIRVGYFTEPLWITVKIIEQVDDTEFALAGIAESDSQLVPDMKAGHPLRCRLDRVTDWRVD